MRIQLFILVLSVALSCGCTTEHYTSGRGDVGPFILQKAIGYGGRPTTTNGLPVIATHWRYLEDSSGFQIHMPRKVYQSAELFLSRAFAGQRHFGPSEGEDGFRLFEVRLTSKGGGIQVCRDESRTIVLIIHPFGQSKPSDSR